MSSVVLDASAILALLHKEPGADVVATHMARAVVSAVNLAEVGARLADWGMAETSIRQAIAGLGVNVAPFDGDMAYVSAALRPMTRDKGLALGDRACLALARCLGLPVLTADRMWADLDVGVDVRVIRER